MRSLFRDRSRLRIPALLGGFVLLLASGVGSAGLDVCLYHGSHQHGAEHAQADHGHDRAHHGSHHEHDHEPNHGHGHDCEHHCEHHRHGAMHGSTGDHEHSHEHPHDHPVGGEDCDFRILCVGAAGIAPLSPQLIEVGDAVATAPRFLPPIDEVEFLQPTLVPHFLPFSTAPPAHS